MAVSNAVVSSCDMFSESGATQQHKSLHSTPEVMGWVRIAPKLTFDNISYVASATITQFERIAVK